MKHFAIESRCLIMTSDSDPDSRGGPDRATFNYNCFVSEVKVGWVGGGWRKQAEAGCNQFDFPALAMSSILDSLTDNCCCSGLLMVKHIPTTNVRSMRSQPLGGGAFEFLAAVSKQRHSPTYPISLAK